MTTRCQLKTIIGVERRGGSIDAVLSLVTTSKIKLQIDILLWFKSTKVQLQVARAGKIVRRELVREPLPPNQPQALVGGGHELAAEQAAQVLLLVVQEGEEALLDVERGEEQLQFALLVGPALELLPQL